MSRIGRKPIPIPSGVKVEDKSGALHVQGPKGSMAAPMPRGITARIADGELCLDRADQSKPTRSAHGLARALFSNMVTGVTEGFVKELDIQGVGYRAEVAGKALKLTLGFSHPVQMPVPEGLKVSVQENRIKVEGVDKQAVGQFASEIRRLRPPEPYKGKGVRYANEQVRRKVGKAGAAS